MLSSQRREQNPRSCCNALHIPINQVSRSHRPAHNSSPHVAKGITNHWFRHLCSHPRPYSPCRHAPRAKQIVIATEPVRPRKTARALTRIHTHPLLGMNLPLVGGSLGRPCLLDSAMEMNLTYGLGIEFECHDQRTKSSSGVTIRLWMVKLLRWFGASDQATERLPKRETDVWPLDGKDVHVRSALMTCILMCSLARRAEGDP